jgi:hypothetical protein
MTFNEFEESVSILFNILKTKEKIKILNISQSMIKGAKNSKRVKSLIAVAKREHEIYTQRKDFDAQLMDRNFSEIGEDYDFMSPVFEIMGDSLQEQSKRRISRLIKFSIMLCSYYMSSERREEFYQLITNLDDK